MKAQTSEPGQEPSQQSGGDAGRPPSAKFRDPVITATGEARAHVRFEGYKTIWFNTGTLCNIECRNCYIESSPRNDRLVYLDRAEVRQFLDEADRLDPRPSEIGFTGGEPFMNPATIAMLEDSLARGYHVLVLTNAMKPMHHVKRALLDLRRSYEDQLSIRVSIDHYLAEKHEEVRGPHTWQPTIDGLVWLAENQFNLAIAGRKVWDETEESMRNGYQGLFESLGIVIDASDPSRVVLFPEMDEGADVPEITERCWGILGKSPSDVMCAASRMVIKRKGSPGPSVVSCTLLPYAAGFELGPTLTGAARPVSLNHPHCARFCVLGNASCSPQS